MPDCRRELFDELSKLIGEVSDVIHSPTGIDGNAGLLPFLRDKFVFLSNRKRRIDDCDQRHAAAVARIRELIGLLAVELEGTGTTVENSPPSDSRVKEDSTERREETPPPAPAAPPPVALEPPPAPLEHPQPPSTPAPEAEGAPWDEPTESYLASHGIGEGTAYRYVGGKPVALDNDSVEFVLDAIENRTRNAAGNPVVARETAAALSPRLAKRWDEAFAPTELTTEQLVERLAVPPVPAPIPVPTPVESPPTPAEVAKAEQKAEDMKPKERRKVSIRDLTITTVLDWKSLTRSKPSAWEGLSAELPENLNAPGFFLATRHIMVEGASVKNRKRLVNLQTPREGATLAPQSRVQQFAAKFASLAPVKVNIIAGKDPEPLMVQHEGARWLRLSIPGVGDTWVDADRMRLLADLLEGVYVEWLYAAGTTGTAETKAEASAVYARLRARNGDLGRVVGILIARAPTLSAEQLARIIAESGAGSLSDPDD